MATAPETQPAEEQETSPAPSSPGTAAPLRPASESPGAFIGASLSGRKHARYLNALFYGRHGAGKSTLAASAVDVPEMEDVLVVTAEGGDVVYMGNPRIKNWEAIDIIKIDRIEQFQKVYEWVRAHIHFRDKTGPEAEKKLRDLQDAAFPPDTLPDPERLRRFRTVVIDSFTEIESLNLTKIMGEDKPLDAGDDFEVAGWPQFRKNMHIIQKAIRNFRDLDVNFLAVCAEAWAQDERKAFHYTPRMTGQLKDIIQGFFDIVGWLVPGQQSPSGDSPRRLYVQPQSAPKADAKCRLATYKEPHFDNPVMADIMKATGFIKPK